MTEYSFSLSSRNVLNDSCMKAAYLLHNAIDCMGKAELMGQYFYSDAFADACDTGTILFGGNGFLTKDGIYIVNTSLVNSHHGSIQDKWIEMNMESDLTRKELNYLRTGSISSISIKEADCRDGCLEIEMDLEPNEIRYVHICRK